MDEQARVAIETLEQAAAGFEEFERSVEGPHPAATRDLVYALRMIAGLGETAMASELVDVHALAEAMIRLARAALEATGYADEEE